jgi:PAS domain S-box-containing protein
MPANQPDGMSRSELIQFLEELALGQTTAQTGTEHLRLSLAQAGVTVWWKDLASGECETTDRLSTLGVHVPDEVPFTFDHLIEAIHPDDRQGLLLAIHEALHTGKRFEYEHRILSANGDSRWVLHRGAAGRNQAGTPTHLSGVMVDATRHKREQDALAESEAHYRQQIDLAADAILVVEVQAGLLVAANRKAEALFARPRLSLIGRPFSSLWAEQHQASCHALLQDALRGRKSFPGVQLLGSSGNKLTTEITASTIEIGHKRFLQVIVRDVTGRRQAEQALRASEERFRQLVNHIQEIFWVAEPAARRMLYVSPAFEQVMGIPVSAVLSNSRVWLDKVVPEDRPLALDALERQAQCQAVDVDFRFVRGDGAVRWLRTRSTPGHDAHGLPIAYGLSEDITERKLSELALRQSEERLRHLAENVHEVFWVADRDLSRFEYVSPSFHTLWGTPADTLYVDPDAWRIQVMPEDLGLLEAAFEKQRSGQPSEADFRIQHRDRTLRWIRARFFPSVTSDGRAIVHGILGDLTEQKLAEHERLEAARLQRDAVVREVHHRIKNNLQGVAGLLRNEADRNPELKPALDRAIGQIQSMAVMYGLQGKDANRRLILCDIVPAIAKSVSELFQMAIHVSGIQEMRRSVQVAEGESVAIALIINELLVNATKHARKEVGELKLHLELLPSGARLTITNPGTLPPGINFSEGLGLGTGLSLVRALMPAKGVKLLHAEDRGNVHTILEFSTPYIRIAMGGASAAPVHDHY